MSRACREDLRRLNFFYPPLLSCLIRIRPMSSRRHIPFVLNFTSERFVAAQRPTGDVRR
jgi:hypothetical protein